MSGPHVEDPTYSPRAAASLVWTPPPVMGADVAAGWRTFYRHVHATYGITPAQYRDLYVAQHGCCYICRKAKGKNPDDYRGRGGRRLAVDHNHVTGNVRGLLCSGGDKTCNRIIGWLTVEALRRAVEYVETEPAQAVFLARREMDALAAVGGRDFPDPDGFLKTVLDLS